MVRILDFSERRQERKTEFVEACDFMGIKPKNSSWNHGLQQLEPRISLISRIKKGLRCEGCSPGGWPRKGRPPLDNDFPFLGDIRLCSAPRAWLENMRRSRKRGAEVARTLSKAELEERLDGLLRQGGEAALNRLRDAARDVSQKLGLADEFRSLDELIGTFLGTREAKLATAVGQARKSGLPYDPDRLVLFQSLFAELRARGPVTRPSKSMVDSAKTNLAFFESYFSISVRQDHSPGSSARFCPEIHRLHSVGGFRFSQSGFASYQCVHGCERGGR